MQKLKTFIRTLIQSITRPSYYVDVVQAKFSFALKYFTFFHFFFALAISIFVMILLSVVNFPALATQVLSNVPSDLVVHIEDGQLSVNKPLPYAIPFPAAWQQNQFQFSSDNGVLDTTQPIKNLVVFDTDKDVQGMSDFYAYQTEALVTEDFVYYRDSQQSNEVRTVPISTDMKPMTIDTNQIIQAKNWFFNLSFIKYKLYLIVIGAFLVLLLTALLTLFHFVTAAIYSVIMYVLANLFKDSFFRHRKYTYTQVLQVSLVTFVPLILLQLILTHLGMSWLDGWRFFLGYLLITGIALWGAAEQTAVIPTGQLSSTARSAKAKPKARIAKKSRTP